MKNTLIYGLTALSIAAGCSTANYRAQKIRTNPAATTQVQKLSSEWNLKTMGLSQLDHRNFRFTLDHLVMGGRPLTPMLNCYPLTNELLVMFYDNTKTELIYVPGNETLQPNPNSVIIYTRMFKSNGSPIREVEFASDGPDGIKVKRKDQLATPGVETGLFSTGGNDLVFNRQLTKIILGKDEFYAPKFDNKNPEVPDALLIPAEGTAFKIGTNGALTLISPAVYAPTNISWAADYLRRKENIASATQPSTSTKTNCTPTAGQIEIR